jgi:DNA invertase Pin-like site-specific DNA recombinase
MTTKNKKKRGKRVVIYARVSTTDKGQDPETQLRQLREYAERRDFILTSELVDRASGTREDRSNYKKLFELVRRREVDVVLVWRYDRFARSTQALVNALTEFESLGVDFISYQENIDTTTPQGKMVFTIMASIAQFESALISERVRAGMERAKAEGKRIGRRPTPKDLHEKIRSLKKKHPSLSIDAIAEHVGVSHGTAWKSLRSR